MNRYITLEQASDLLDLSPKTLTNYRYTQPGFPKPAKRGYRRVPLWNESDLLSWRNGTVQTPENVTTINERKMECVELQLMVPSGLGGNDILADRLALLIQEMQVIWGIEARIATESAEQAA